MKLNWCDLLNIWLWHRYSNDELVNDDTAYVALLRVAKFVDFAITALEAPTPVEKPEE